MMPPRVLASGPKPCGGNYLYLSSPNTMGTIFWLFKSKIITTRKIRVMLPLEEISEIGDFYKISNDLFHLLTKFSSKTLFGYFLRKQCHYTTLQNVASHLYSSCLSFSKIL